MQIQTTNTYQRIKDVDARIICLRGGTRSSKSFSLMQVVVIWLMTGEIGGRTVETGVFSVVRSTLPALKATVYKDMINYLHELGIYPYINHIKTTLEFHYNGREVVFFSLDDSHKLRGRQHTFLWFNEVNDIDFETWNQGVFRTTHSIYNDYNPSGEPFIKTEIEEKRLVEKGDVHLDVSVYTDNPFLPDLLVQEIIGLETVDNDLWRIYTKGEWVVLKGLIFPNFNVVPDVPLIGKAYYGMDFGYNDPNVLVKVTIYKEDLWIETLIYKREMLIDEMATEMKKFIRQTDVVYCDSAEPRTIEELRRRGVNAKKAKKGPDSVRQSLTFIKQHRIHVHQNSVDTIEEFKRYKWMQDKEGRFQDKPINLYKHSADAVSYSVTKALSQRIRLL